MLAAADVRAMGSSGGGDGNARSPLTPTAFPVRRAAVRASYPLDLSGHSPVWEDQRDAGNETARDKAGSEYGDRGVSDGLETLLDSLVVEVPFEDRTSLMVFYRMPSLGWYYLVEADLSALLAD